MTIDRAATASGEFAWTMSIDFGTSSTVVAATTPDGQTEVVEIAGERRVPSVLMLEDDDSWVVGRAAVDLAGSRPDRIIRSPKRRLGDQTPVVVAGKPFPAVLLASKVIRYAADSAVSYMGSEPAALRMTFPATWNRPLRARLLEAAAKAGLPEPMLIREPVAAAHSLPSQLEVGAAIAIYDLGGGTFDTTIVRSTDEGWDVIGRPNGDPAFGGELFDEALMNHVGERIDPDVWDQIQVSDELAWRQTHARLLAECRRVKEALSNNFYGEVVVGSPGGLIQQRVTREELEQIVGPYIDESAEVLLRSLHQAGVEAGELSAIHLIGGASRMPLVAERIALAVPGVPIEQLGDPRTAVALGACRAKPIGSQLASTPAIVATTTTDAENTTKTEASRQEDSGSQIGSQPPLPPARPVRADVPGPSVPPLPPSSDSRSTPGPRTAAAGLTQQDLGGPQANPLVPPIPAHPPTTVPSDQAAAPQLHAPPLPVESTESNSKTPIVAAAVAGTLLLLAGGVFAISRLGDDPAGDIAAPTSLIDSFPTLPQSTTTTPTTASTTTSTTAESTTTTVEATTTTVAVPETIFIDGGPTRTQVMESLVRLVDLPTDEWTEQVEAFAYEPLLLCGAVEGELPIYIDGRTFAKETEGIDDLMTSSMLVYPTEEAAQAAIQRDREMFANCAGGPIEVNGQTFDVEIITPDGDPAEGLGDEVLIGGSIMSLDGTPVAYTLSTQMRWGRTVGEVGYSAGEPVSDDRTALLLEVTIGSFIRQVSRPR